MRSEDEICSVVIIGGKISKPNEDSGRATRRFQKGIFQEQAYCVMYAVYSICICIQYAAYYMRHILYDLKIALCQSQIRYYKVKCDITPCYRMIIIVIFNHQISYAKCASQIESLM